MLLPKETEDSIKKKFFEIAISKDKNLSRKIKSKTHIHRKYAIEQWIKLKRAQRKVICVENNKIYEDCYIAGKQLKIRNIGNCCDGNQKTAGGYHWKYVEEENKND